MNATKPKKLKMNSEMRRKMAGLLPMDSNAVYPWTPDVYLKRKRIASSDDESGFIEVFEIDEELHPVFDLSQFSNEQIIEIKTMISTEMNTKTKKVNIEKTDAKNQIYMQFLHTVLKGWTNLYDLGSGELFEYDGTFETMMKLPETIRTDLFSEAMKISGFIPQG